MANFAQLQNKTAVVTGSSSGIGRAIALELARAGARLLVHYANSQDAALETVNQIESMTGQAAELLACDFSHPEPLESFPERVWEKTDGVDIWVNNAGVDLLTGDAKEYPPSTKLEKLLDIDVKSTVLLSREVGNRMFEQGRGVILNIGWDQADRGMEGLSGELFAVSKNAIMGFSRSLAVSLAPKVRVNCIAPGWIKTAWGEIASDEWQQRVLDETPLKRWGLPEDIAKMARFLVSDDADYITGQVINVNGGAIR
ncbi:MAG: SDR family oxidoreductase [Planctomycetaceae bacterium]|nr:SDR family oxidoreductase [Planctomycetaceae bacterium]